MKMTTCRFRRSDPGFEEGDNFKEFWQWEYLERDVSTMPHKIFRWRCKDTKNDIPFYYLELEKPEDAGIFRRTRILSFRNNEERTMFLLTYFFR